MRSLRCCAHSLDDKDVGASVAVYVDGEPVVDLWGGYADAARTDPWERDTITNVWSTTKTMTALCALVLADRGELDLDAPVGHVLARVRGERARRTCRSATCSAHTAGLPGWDAPMTLEDLYDWPTATALLAAQAPGWEPGTASGYHAAHPGLPGRRDRPPDHRPHPGHVLRRGGRRAAGRRLPHRAARRARRPGGARRSRRRPGVDMPRRRSGTRPPGNPAIRDRDGQHHGLAPRARSRPRTAHGNLRPAAPAASPGPARSPAPPAVPRAPAPVPGRGPGAPRPTPPATTAPPGPRTGAATDRASSVT